MIKLPTHLYFVLIDVVYTNGHRDVNPTFETFDPDEAQISADRQRLFLTNSASVAESHVAVYSIPLPKIVPVRASQLSDLYVFSEDELKALSGAFDEFRSALGKYLLRK